MGLTIDISDVETSADENGNQTLNDVTSRLIREQVRAIVREEMRATGSTVTPSTSADSTSSAPAPVPAEPEDRTAPPPSYDDSAVGTRPNDTGPSDEMHSEAARLLATDDVEALSPSPEALRGTWLQRAYHALPGWIRGLIIFLPLGATLVTMVVLCVNWDVLALSAMAFLLVMANYGALLLAFMVGGFLGGYKNPDETGSKKERDETVGLVVTHHFLFAWGVFTLIMWSWLASGKSTMVPRYMLAAEFDGKITQHDALQFVTTCMYEMSPARNASIDDISTCLKKLGMPRTVIP